MIEWLTENSMWLSALGAIAAVIAFVVQFLKGSPVERKVSAKRGGVASGGDMKGVKITTNHSAYKESDDGPGA